MEAYDHDQTKPVAEFLATAIRQSVTRKYDVVCPSRFPGHFTGTIRPPDNILDPLCHARKEASALSSPPSDRQGLFPATRDSRQSSRQQINQSTERPDKNLHRTSSLRVNKQNVPINGPAHC
ncbi:hypothetical protein LSTR_LSTR014996 [Laodelphax striatellus]|uniref:Uncharacterized protein n=1 Tax=Laodelphax striatellus TaxID=195883 RepID=A0A482X7G1_LAOST|nr:hypothetical protein LSTR_LSTR014996 [Laodelphax striatellus]